MYSFHFVKFLPLYVARIEFISPLICLFFSLASISPSVYLALPPFPSLSKPSLFILGFQHPLSVLGPSVLALKLLLSLPSARLSPCLSDVKYHPFTHLHLIFSRPSPSPSYLPLISHTSDGGQVHPLKFVHVSFFLHLFFFLHLSFCLSKRAFHRLSVIGIASISVWACEHRKEGRMEGWWWIGLCGRLWALRKGGTEPLKRGGPNQKDVLRLESFILVMCRAAG